MAKIETRHRWAKSNIIAVRLPQKTFEEITRMAEKRGESMSEMIRIAMSLFLTEKSNKHKTQNAN